MDEINKTILQILTKKDMTSKEIFEELVKMKPTENTAKLKSLIYVRLFSLRAKGLVDVVGEKNNSHIYSLNKFAYQNVMKNEKNQNR